MLHLTEGVFAGAMHAKGLKAQASLEAPMLRSQVQYYLLKASHIGLCLICSISDVDRISKH